MMGQPAKILGPQALARRAFQQTKFLQHLVTFDENTAHLVHLEQRFKS
jgi:hypothetical protein